MKSCSRQIMIPAVTKENILSPVNKLLKFASAASHRRQYVFCA